jgi:2-iminobutanoate/2-iminopropanoate deaminase
MEKIYTNKAPEAIGPYSQAIVCNGMVYTSGQIAINPATGQVEAETIEGQTYQVISNLEEVLSAANTSIENVVKTTCFLKEMSDFAAFNSVYEKFFVNKPARSCVAAKELPRNVLVEIEVIAIVK